MSDISISPLAYAGLTESVLSFSHSIYFPDFKKVLEDGTTPEAFKTQASTLARAHFQKLYPTEFPIVKLNISIETWGWKTVMVFSAFSDWKLVASQSEDVFLACNKHLVLVQYNGVPLHSAINFSFSILHTWRTPESKLQRENIFFPLFLRIISYLNFLSHTPPHNPPPNNYLLKFKNSCGTFKSNTLYHKLFYLLSSKFLFLNLVGEKMHSIPDSKKLTFIGKATRSRRKK